MEKLNKLIAYFMNWMNPYTDLFKIRASPLEKVFCDKMISFANYKFLLVNVYGVLDMGKLGSIYKAISNNIIRFFNIKHGINNMI